MNRRTLCFVSALVVSAILVPGVGPLQAQTPGQIPMFDPASGPGSCNTAGAIDCVDSVIYQDSFNNVFINGTTPITFAEKFGVRGTAGPGVYTGMYIDGSDPASWPFYGYSTNGVGTVWHYFHGGTGQWRLYNSGDRIAVLNNGMVGIGTTAPDQLLSVNGNASKIGGGFWAVFSDDRLKTIHGSFDAGLNEVLKLKPIRYRYNKDNPLNIRDEGEHIGLSAQQVQSVIPEAVTENSKGYLMLNGDPVLWAMLNAIKEQQKMIEELKKKASEIDGLRAQLSEMKELKGQMSKLQNLLQTVLAQRPEESGSVLTSGR